MIHFLIHVAVFALAAVGCLFIGAFTCEFFAALRADRRDPWPFGTGRIQLPSPEIGNPKSKI